MEARSRESGIRRAGWLAAALWSLVVAASLLLGIHHAYEDAEAQAGKVAKSHLDKDQAFRQWVSARGGLYAPINELTQPNPFMGHVASQDIQTPVGPMTLLNPAYILRLLMDEYGTLYGIKGRIVGLKALNPNNLADPWETKVIGLFEKDRDKQDYAEVSEVDGAPYLRMMVPMYMKPDCLKCHAHLGYQLGDLRGGVNVSVPLKDFHAAALATSINLGISHGGIGLLGLFGIGFVTQRTLKDARQREAAIAELELAAHVFDDSLQSIMITDGQVRIQRVNRRFSQLTGYAADEVIGANPSLLSSGRHDREFYKSLWHTIQQDGVWQGEISNRRKNGEEFVVWESIIALPDDNGKPKHFIGLMEDITQRKQAEANLQRLNQELEQRVTQRTSELLAAKEESERANQAKSEFLSQMSHELRTPLNAILGFTQLLITDQKQPLAATQKEDLGEVMRAGTHLLDLINDILDLARVESGKIAVELVPVDLAALLDQSTSLIRPSCAAAAIALVVHSELPGSTQILCDPTRLRQIFLNLLSNAVKYNRPNGTIRIDVADTDHGYIRIQVRDEGQGMSKDELVRLFSPFERLARHAHIEGTGIGLALSRRLIEAMGGKIGAEVNADVGMTFWLELPRATEAP